LIVSPKEQRMFVMLISLGSPKRSDLPVRNADLRKMQELRIEWDAIKRAE
jgi:hypothetical protein